MLQLEPPITLGQYSLFYFLGAGKYGKVYAARCSLRGEELTVLKICWEGDDSSLDAFLRNPSAIAPHVNDAFLQQFAGEDSLLRALEGPSERQLGKRVIPRSYERVTLRGLEIIEMEYIGEQLPNSTLPDWIAIQTINFNQDDQARIPEPIVLEIGRRFLTVLSILHSEQSLFLIDAQIDNLRVQRSTIDVNNLRRLELPKLLELLELRILDWNGTNPMEDSAFPYPVAHDIWFVFSFMFEMLTGKSIPERRSVTIEFLSAQPHWQHISPGTRALLQTVLSRPCGQVDLKDYEYLERLERRIRSWSQPRMTVAEADKASFEEIEDARWLAKFSHSAEDEQRAGDLLQNMNSKRSRLQNARDALNTDRIGTAVDLFKNEIPDAALSLDDLRWKLALIDITKNQNADPSSLSAVLQALQRAS